MDWNVIEFSEEYKEKVIKFWLKICVQEFGFEDWKEDVKTTDNHEYKDNKGNFWIAINNDNEVIGTIALKNLGNNEACLKSLYVKKEYRKNGIAKLLFDKFMEFAKSNNYKKIELDTYDAFENAIRFYQKNGFKVKQHIENKYVLERKV